MNHLTLWKDFVLFWGSNPRSITNHQHPIIQWVLGVKDSFLSRAENGTWEKKKSLLIAPNHAHECDASNIEIITIAIDPESLLGEWILQKYLQDNLLIDFLSDVPISQMKSLLADESWVEVRIMIESLFQYQSGVILSKEKDGRIQQVLRYITENIESKIDTKSLLEIAHLSESRLLHLFKSQMGLPIRNYILWYRLQLAIKYVLSGQNLTQAAFSAGFADQSHLTRTCVSMLGVPPSLLVKNSKFIQVSISH